MFFTNILTYKNNEYRVCLNLRLYNCLSSGVIGRGASAPDFLLYLQDINSSEYENSNLRSRFARHNTRRIHY